MTGCIRCVCCCSSSCCTSCCCGDGDINCEFDFGVITTVDAADDDAANGDAADDDAANGDASDDVGNATEVPNE